MLIIISWIKDLAMINKQKVSAKFEQLLVKYPHLKKHIEKGDFLTGYTAGSCSGAKVTVFLVRSPWTQFCLQATAMGALPPGAVLLVTEQMMSSPISPWKAYTLETEIENKSPERKPSKVNRLYSKSKPNLASVAAEIALEIDNLSIKNREIHNESFSR